MPVRGFGVRRQSRHRRTEAVFTVHFDGLYKKKWGFWADLSYLEISDQQTTPGHTLDVNFKETMAELGAIYRFYNRSTCI